MSAALLHMQSTWRKALLAPETSPTVCGRWSGGVRDAEAGFAVYVNNIRANLLHAMAMTYPATQVLAGVASFRRAVLSGLVNAPPVSGDLGDYGGILVDEIAKTVTEDLRQVIQEVARYEWIADQVSREKHEPSWTLGAAANLPAEHWPELQLRLVRQSRLYSSPVPVQLWIGHALQNSAIPLPRQERLLLLSGDNDVQLLCLDKVQWAWLEAIDHSLSLAQATQAALTLDAQFDPQAILMRLISAGAIAQPDSGSMKNSGVIA